MIYRFITSGFVWLLTGSGGNDISGKTLYWKKKIF